MDSEDDTKDDVDSGNESSGDDVDFAMDVETHSTRERQTELEEYPYEVLSTEEIVQHMVDCIKEVNTVVEVSMLVVNNEYLNEVTRILEHFNRIFCVALELDRNSLAIFQFFHSKASKTNLLIKLTESMAYKPGFFS
jgi:hypothetical protein